MITQLGSLVVSECIGEYRPRNSCSRMIFSELRYSELLIDYFTLITFKRYFNYGNSVANRTSLKYNLLGMPLT